MGQSVFAAIVEGIVRQLMVGTFPECSEVAKTLFGKDVFIIETWSLFYPAGVQIPVEVGDSYHNGDFYHNGEVVAPVPTIDNIILQNTQVVEQHTEKINNNSDAIDEIIIAITPTKTSKGAK